MTIAAQLRQEGWWDGRRQGVLIGHMENCQEPLNLTVRGLDELLLRSEAELEALFLDLSAQAHRRAGPQPDHSLVCP